MNAERERTAMVELDLTTIPLEGIRLIEASAGTGKTHTITSLFLRLVVERDLRLREICAVTFTTAATAELRDRVAKRLLDARKLVELASDGDDRALEKDLVLVHLVRKFPRKTVLKRLERALHELDQSAIFTIHGFCQRVLREHALVGGTRLDAELLLDSERLIQEAFRDFWDSKIATRDPRELELLGTLPYESLAKAAKAALDHVELPVVELPEASLATLVAELEPPFRALAENAHLVNEAGEVLLGRANRNTFREPTTRAAMRKWKKYLASDTPAPLLEESMKKWRASHVAEKGTKGKGAPLSHPFFDLVEPLVEKYESLDAARKDVLAGLRRDMVVYARERVRVELDRTRAQTFDDLLLELVRALRDPRHGEALARSLRKRFPVFLIDEFQDTDPIQCEIFEKIFGAPKGRERVLFFIGDPKQSIYSFRGADIDAYLAARSRASEPKYTLPVSYRAGPRLVAAQNTLFSSLSRPFLVDAVDYPPVSSRAGRVDRLEESHGSPSSGVRFIAYDASESEAAKVTADTILAQLLSGATIRDEDAPESKRRIRASDIAVLARTNRVAARVQAHLRKLGIPAVLHGDRSVFESDEALELRRVLRALLEPRSGSLLRAALATRLLGVDAEGLAGFGQDEDGLERTVADFVHCSQIWHSRGIAFALYELDRRARLMVRMLGEPDGERMMTNYRHLLELLHEAETTEHLGPASLLRFFESAIKNPLGHAMAPEARQLRLESDDNAVTLTTVHRSKGLEYGIVYLVDTEAYGTTFKSDTFRIKKDGVAYLDVRGPKGEGQEILTELDRQEGMRLLYVALTRAEHQVNVLYSPVTKTEPKRGKDGKFDVLRYLVHGGAVGSGSTLESYLGRINRHEELARLARLAEGSSGAIEVVRFERINARFERDEPAPEELHARQPRALPRFMQRTSSFSGLTRGLGHPTLSRAAREGRDVDETLDSTERLRTSPSFGDVRVSLADFPRGAGPGEALHAILERVVFSPGDAELRERIAREEFDRRALLLEEPELRDAAVVGLDEILRTPVLPSGVRLVDLEAHQLFPEMEFSFPLGKSGSLLSVERLARALGSRGTPFSRRYLDELRALNFSELQGFLRGYIDLVFESDGKYYVLDYKSNYLGDTLADYARERLEEAMISHHYHLQGALYAVALHRFLVGALGEARAKTSFGGVVYLFVRGMHPDSGLAYGVHTTEPTVEFLASLSAALEDPLALAAPSEGGAG